MVIGQHKPLLHWASAFFLQPLPCTNRRISVLLHCLTVEFCYALISNHYCEAPVYAKTCDASVVARDVQ